MELKLSCISGLKDIVRQELKQYPDLKIAKETEEDIYLDDVADFGFAKKLKSVTKVSIVEKGEKLNPAYISKHKSILGKMIEKILSQGDEKFKTFTIYCAGSDSTEVVQIKEYIKDTYKLIDSEDADLKIYIHKPSDMWEVSAQITARPLSVREYRVENIKGGMNPTIAYAMNTFANLEHTESYLNAFSGSATLLIEAGLINPKLKLVGFDKDGKTNALAVKNIKKAGLIKAIQLRTADIIENPDLGRFDTIVADLPFGMLISKNESLDTIYEAFVRYAEKTLENKGTLVIYTSEHEILSEILAKSKFAIITELSLKILASQNSYLYTKIFVCKFKNNPTE